MRVEVTRRVLLNLTGYDREGVLLEPGTHEVPDRAADWFRRNPSYGHVLGDVPESAPVDGDGDPETAAAEAEVTESASEAPEPEPEQDVDLASLTVEELRSLAAEAGIAGRSGMNKDQLIGALSAGDQPEGEE